MTRRPPVPDGPEGKLRRYARSRPGPLPTPCLIWDGPRNNYDYGILNVRSDSFLVHRYVWERDNGPIPPGKEVLHACDTPPCFALDHLRVGTRGDNMADARERGRTARGSRNGRATLTEEQVMEIYEIVTSPNCPPYAELVVRYGVQKSTFSNIKYGTLWSHLTGARRGA